MTTGIQEADLTHDFSSDASATGNVNIAELQTQLQLVIDYLNDQIKGAVLDPNFRSDNTLADNLILLRMLHPEVLTLIASAAGWQPKTAANTGTTANINLAAPGASVGGLVMSAGFRVAVLFQTLPQENGIYVWNGAAVPMTRASDADTAAELGLAFVAITSGDQQGTAWIVTQNPAAITLGTTPITWLQMTGTQGIIPISKGGTGAITAAAARLALGISAAIDPVVTAATTAAARATMGGLPFTVDTMAALKALPLNDLAGTVVVRGYYAAGDGGDGFFRWDAASAAVDNGGNIIAPTAVGVGPGRWVRENYDHINVQHFGAIPDPSGITDRRARLQAALDAGAGYRVHIPAGTYPIGDTLLIPPSTQVYGDNAGDNWGVTSSEKGSRILTIGTPTARVWTDVTFQPLVTWNTITDAPITVAIVLNGSGSSVKDIKLSGTPTSTGAWGAGFFLPSVKRISFTGVETDGYFSITGAYLDATWGSTNTALLNLMSGTYGLTIHPDTGMNECTFTDCYFLAGKWGVFGKGTDRAATDDPTSTKAWVWCPGGVSDMTFYGCRFSNRPYGDGNYGGAYYADWGGADRTAPVKWYQNRYFYGCSFRASGVRRAVLLDRCNYDSFVGCYGEAQSANSTVLMTGTVDALGTVVKFTTGRLRASGDGPAYRRVYLTDTTRIDQLNSLWTQGALVTASSGGSFTIGAIGYDASAGRAFFFASGFTGSVTAGATLTQAAGQVANWIFSATDRTTFLFSQGQGIFGTTSDSYSYQSADRMAMSELYAGGLTTTPTYAELGNDIETHVNCENGTQVNLYINKNGSSALAQGRLRFDNVSWSTYQNHDLGSAARNWKRVFLGSGTQNLMISTGTGSPEGIVTAVVGSLFLRTDGGATTTLYVKTSGVGNTGWTAK